MEELRPRPVERYAPMIDTDGKGRWWAHIWLDGVKHEIAPARTRLTVLTELDKLIGEHDAREELKRARWEEASHG